MGDVSAVATSSSVETKDDLILTEGQMTSRLKCFGLVLFLAAITTSADAGQEELAVEKVIKTMADTITNFPKDKNIEKVLSVYAGDHEGISDGVRESLQDVRAVLGDLKEQLDLGKQIGISQKVSNVKAHVVGGAAWATFDYTLKIGDGGEVVDESTGLCTAVLAKRGNDWKIVHDHCSSPKREEPPAGAE